MPKNQNDLVKDHPQKQRIVIPCSNSYEFVTIGQILRCEGLQNYSRVFLTDTRMLICTCTIGVLRKQLRPYGIIACHKSHLINQAHITRYAKEGYVQMADESCVPVSRRQRPAFMEQVIDKYNVMTINNAEAPVVDLITRKSNDSLETMSKK